MNPAIAEIFWKEWKDILLRGHTPADLEKFSGRPAHERISGWVDSLHQLSSRQPRRYESLNQATERMQSENRRLTPDQARHLTIHGMTQNEDGTYSWKFDNYVRVWPPYDMTGEEIAALWSRIACPTLLVYGKESWAKNPAEDGRAALFRDARILGADGAGHWVHHDRLELFLREVRAFLRD